VSVPYSCEENFFLQVPHYCPIPVPEFESSFWTRQFCAVMSESVNSMPRVYFPGSVIINPTPRKHSGLVYIRQFQSSRKRWLQIPYTVKSHFTRFRTALSNSTPHNCV
jgi:hypothetical protein